MQVNILKYILKYLTIFNRLYSPQEDLYEGEIKQSHLSWVPRDQTSIILQRNMFDVDLALKIKNKPLSLSYAKVVMKEIKNLTGLLSAEKQMKQTTAKLLPTLNVMEESHTVDDLQPQ